MGDHLCVEQISIHVANVNVWTCGEAAFNLAAIRVQISPQYDASSPASGKEVLRGCKIGKRCGSRIAARAGKAGV